MTIATNIIKPINPNPSTKKIEVSESAKKLLIKPAMPEVAFSSGSGEEGISGTSASIESVADDAVVMGEGVGRIAEEVASGVVACPQVGSSG